MTFNIFLTQRVFCFGQDDRIHDLISPDLRGNKRPVFRQLLVDEFHFSAVFKWFYPLLVWHVRGTSDEATCSPQVYVVRNPQVLAFTRKNVGSVQNCTDSRRHVTAFRQDDKESTHA